MSTAIFDSSFSANGMKPTASTQAPSMADSLPSINFGFDDLRERMNRFTVRFDRFIAQGKERVLQEHNHYLTRVSTLVEERKARSTDIKIVVAKSHQHSEALAREAQEAHELNTIIADLEAQQSSVQSKREALQSQILDLKSQIAVRKDAQAQYQKYLTSQSQHNAPELDFWESYLCLRIEGAGQEDRLKFVFSHVTEKDWEKECWFELGMGSRDYEVLRCRPKLEKGRVEGAVERLNERRELGGFLKEMRVLFAEALK